MSGTEPRPTSSPTSLPSPAGRNRRCPSPAPTSPPRTGRRSATTGTSSTSAGHTSLRWGRHDPRPTASTTSGRVAATRSEGGAGVPRGHGPRHPERPCATEGGGPGEARRVERAHCSRAGLVAQGEPARHRCRCLGIHAGPVSRMEEQLITDGHHVPAFGSHGGEVEGGGSPAPGGDVTRDTVAKLTPAKRATSLIVGGAANLTEGECQGKCPGGDSAAGE